MGNWKVVGCKVTPEVYDLLATYGPISSVLRDAIDMYLRSRSYAKRLSVNQADTVVNHAKSDETIQTKGDLP
jgi:hypothetical protein